MAVLTICCVIMAESDVVFCWRLMMISEKPHDILTTLNEKKVSESYKGFCKYLLKKLGLCGNYSWEDVWSQAMFRLVNAHSNSPNSIFPEDEVHLNNIILMTLKWAANDLNRGLQKNERVLNERESELGIDSFDISTDPSIHSWDFESVEKVFEISQNNINTRSGRFLLRVFTENKTIKELAADENISMKTAQSYFQKRNFQPFVEAFKRCICKEFSDNDEFIRIAKEYITTGETVEVLLKRLRKYKRQSQKKVIRKGKKMIQMVQFSKNMKKTRIQMGALAYRNKLSKLCEMSQRIVFRFEAGSDLDDIVMFVAKTRYHAGNSDIITKDEIRAASLEVCQLIREIRSVFGL